MAAEPLRPASWFSGAPPPGLGFPASSPSGPWRPNELVPAEVNKYPVISLYFILKVKFKEKNSETVNMLAITHGCLKSLIFILQLPPSYEQVIKEINQVQVNTTNNNNAAATPRHTITSATQTDFSEEIDNNLPQSNASDLSSLILT